MTKRELKAATFIRFDGESLNDYFHYLLFEFHLADTETECFTNCDGSEWSSLLKGISSSNAPKFKLMGSCSGVRCLSACVASATV